MMKSTKPISSPGRTTEKFPPPLMRFLRSNVGNKSTKRGGRRSRASPMFFRKKNTNIEAIQEPSSPKVTCIGQVRVRRSKKNKNTAATTSTVATTAAVRPRKSRNSFCRCIRKLKPRSIFNDLSKWVSFFRCGYCESSTFLDDSQVDVRTPVSVIKKVAGKNGEEEEEKEVEEEEDINQGLISKSPPKNAFLLTRCRSAPYRSSSLANKFWESGMEKEGEEEEIAEKIKDLKIKKEDENGEVVNEEEGGSKCNERNEVEEELKAVKEVQPLILNRCKSEPARTWNQLLIV